MIIAVIFAKNLADSASESRILTHPGAAHLIRRPFQRLLIGNFIPNLT